MWGNNSELGFQLLCTDNFISTVHLIKITWLKALNYFLYTLFLIVAVITLLKAFNLM